MKTEQLVPPADAELTPVRHIACPAIRFAWWLPISVPAAAVIVWAFGLRPDLPSRLASRAFLIEEGRRWLPFTRPSARACPIDPRGRYGCRWRPWPCGLARPDSNAWACTSISAFTAAQWAAWCPRSPSSSSSVAAGIPHHPWLSLRALGAAALGAAAFRLYHMEDAAIMVIELLEMAAKLFVIVVMVSLDGCLLDGPVHPIAPGS